MLIKCTATGSRYCTQHFIHHSKGSDRLQILTLPEYLRVSTVSGLYENVFGISVARSGTIPQAPRMWTGSDSDSWLHARWRSISIEKMPSILSLVRRCTAQHCGRDFCFAGRGISSYRISSRL